MDSLSEKDKLKKLETRQQQKQMKLQKKAELDDKRAPKRQRWTEARKKKLPVN